MNNNDMPDTFLNRNAAAIRKSGVRVDGAGLGDYEEPFILGVRPATSMPRPAGPADFPVALGPSSIPKTLLEAQIVTNQLLARILEELVRQNTPSVPSIRSVAATDVGQTLDWQAVGTMDRLMIRNKGTDSVWFSFDISGPAVVNQTSDESFELQANESVNLTHAKFRKIGLRCATGKTATVNSIAFQSVAGDQAAAIS